MSIVLLIIGLVAGGAATIFVKSLDQKQADETKAKMQVLQKALLDFRRVNNRLPCPASFSYLTTSQYFGIEAATPGLCTGGTPASSFSTAASSFTGTTTSGSATVTSVSSVTGLSAGMVVSAAAGITAGTTISSVDSSTQITLNANASATGSRAISFNTFVGGQVPTKTLGLPDDYAVDGWGRRIEYAVDARMTGSSPAALLSTSIAITDTTTRMSVNDASGNARSSKAAYVLISFGQNGHGAYPRGSTSRIDVDSTNTDELNNCDCDADAVAGTFNGTFVQKFPTVDTTTATLTNNFDDIVMFATRADLRGFRD